MGITYDQDYIELPRGTDPSAQDTQGKSHNSYFAQTAARNLNHCLAEKTCPVLMTFYDPLGNGWGTSGTNMGPRGKAILWRPHYGSIILVGKFRRNTGSGTGYLTLEVWAEDQYKNTGAKYQSAADASSDDLSWQDVDLTITNPDIGTDRMAHIYLTLENADLLTCCVYAGKFNG